MLDLEIPEIEFAINTVRQASLLVQEIQGELVSPAMTKDDRSPVTIADFASQAVVGRLLAKAFPYDPFIAEEDSRSLNQPGAENSLDTITKFVNRQFPQATKADVIKWIDHARVNTATRFWTLDPIDGTKGFLRGDQYAIAFALIVDGEVQVGVLGCPKLNDAYLSNLNGPGSLVVAARNQGTWTTPLATSGHFSNLRVSSISNPLQARLLRSFESGHTNVSKVDEFTEALNIQAKPVRMDSQAKYAVLAAGKGELLLRLLSPDKPDYHEKIWDHAAGSLILEEAGGCITDLEGKALDFRAGPTLINNRGIIASNGILHRMALNTLQEISA